MSRVWRRVAVCLFLTAFVALSVQNWVLRRRFGALAREVRSSASPVVTLAVRDSVLRFVLRDAGGVRRDIGAVLGGRARTLYFFRPGCEHCTAQVSAWRDYLALYGAADVVFLDTSGAPVIGFPGLARNAVPVFGVERDAYAVRALPGVPLVVRVNACGLITATASSITTLPPP